MNPQNNNYNELQSPKLKSLLKDWPGYRFAMLVFQTALEMQNYVLFPLVLKPAQRTYDLAEAAKSTVA